MGAETSLQGLIDAASLDERRALLAGGLSHAERVDLSERLKAEADRLLTIDPTRALAVARLIGEVAGEAGDAGVAALGVMAEADALREMGRYSDAVASYDRAAALYRSARDEVGWARSRAGWIFTCRFTGSRAEAITEAERVRAIFIRHHLWFRLARLESYVGHLLTELGRLDEALACYDRAFLAAGRLTPPDESLLAELKGNEALVHFYRGDYEKSAQLHAEAESGFARLGETGRVAQAQVNGALPLTAQGHYSKAMSALRPARRALEAVGRGASAAFAYTMEAECLQRLGRFDEAAGAAEAAVAAFLAMGSGVEAAKALALRSAALTHSGSCPEALVELDRAEALFLTGGFEVRAAAVHLQRAMTLGEQGAWEESLAEAEQAVAVLHKHSERVRAAEATLAAGSALLALGRTAEAQLRLHEVAAKAADRGVPWLSFQAWRLLGGIARDEGRDSDALAAFVAAVDALEKVQSRILTEDRAGFLDGKVEVYEEVVRLLLARGDPEQAFEYAERAKARALFDLLAGAPQLHLRATSPRQRALADELLRLRRRHDQLSLRLLRPDSSLGAAPGVHAQDDTASALAAIELRIAGTVEELRLAGAEDELALVLPQGRVNDPRQSLDAETLLLEFFPIGDDLALFGVDARSIRGTLLSGAMPQLRRLQQMLGLNLAATAVALHDPDRIAALTGSARTLLQRLYTLLLAPVEEWLAGKRRLVIVPHGSLHQLPFACLNDGSSYLVERFETVLLPSASVLAFCRRPRGRTGARSLAVGHSAAGLLPSTVAEAVSVERCFPGTLLLEDNATVSRVLELAPEADIIHLAAHGVHRADAPLFSHLLLADGLLTALDCFNLHLDCSLVTLSACDSGRGVLVAGDELLGLSRALLVAGARAVVQNLWPVEDESARTLMDAFYARLRLGEARAGALRAAQLAFLSSTERSHPFFWGAMVLLGDWGALEDVASAAGHVALHHAL